MPVCLTTCEETELVSISYQQLLRDDPTLPAQIQQACRVCQNCDVVFSYSATSLRLAFFKHYKRGFNVRLARSSSPRIPLRWSLLSIQRHIPDCRSAQKLWTRFQELPESVKNKYSDPLGGLAVVGWSKGIEALENGQPDTHKGSFYANPLHDSVTTDAGLLAKFPSYTTPNVWPSEVPELRAAFQELGQLIISVGLLIARQCDQFAQLFNIRLKEGKLEQVIRDSPNPKGRLLHYYPSTEDAAGNAWCALHTDHGSLTGLLSALYTKNGEEVPNPDSTAGLYIQGRDGKAIKAAIPASHIAFQMGEAMQVHSGGLLRATPHYVRTATGPNAIGVARNTLAIFMQPRWDEPMDAPPGCNSETVGIGQWREGITFGEFSELTVKKYLVQDA